jgi:hypothetical protein
VQLELGRFNSNPEAFTTGYTGTLKGAFHRWLDAVETELAS